MKGRLAPRILAVPLFLALIAAPAVMQEGLVSLWAGWGIPLLGAAAAFALLAGLMRGAAALGSLRQRRRAGAARDGGEPADADADARESAGGAAEDAEADAEAEGDEDAEAEGGAGGDEAAEGEEEIVEPDPVLSEALDELEEENFMDLARALQEMGRHGEALEVLARVAELKEGGHGEEVARALRRMRRQLGGRGRQHAGGAASSPRGETAESGETDGQAPGGEPSPGTQEPSPGTQEPSPGAQEPSPGT